MTIYKKQQYQIQYNDNSYRIVEWTKPEFSLVSREMQGDSSVALLDDGIFRLTDIRTIVLIPEPEPQEEGADEETLTEWGAFDAETTEWLKANGIDIGKRGK